jgi:hypothetical protein
VLPRYLLAQGSSAKEQTNRRAAIETARRAYNILKQAEMGQVRPVSRPAIAEFAKSLS